MQGSIDTGRNYAATPTTSIFTKPAVSTASYIGGHVTYSAPATYETTPVTYATAPVAYGTNSMPHTPPVLPAVAEAGSLLKSCICEFFGTLVLYFVVVVYSGAQYFYIAFFYVALVSAFSFPSGAHFNPAISLAMLLVRRMPLDTFVAYVISQILGGVIGGLCFRGLFYGTNLTVTVTQASSYTLADALFVQAIYTTMLIFVVLNVSVTPNVGDGRKQFFGIAVGFAILAGGSVVSVVSKGALFNPALCFGLMVSSFSVGSCVWYILVELVSALVAVILFMVCRHHDVFSDDVLMDSISMVNNWRAHPTRSTATQSSSTMIWSELHEFLGTFWFVITLCLNVSLDTGYYALSGGGALVSLIYALGYSGGCFNPAVTFAIMCSGRSKFTRTQGLRYIGMQFLAAILAAISARAISKSIGLSSAYSWIPIVSVEFFLTLVFAFVVLVMTTEMHFWPLVIGLAFFGTSNAAYSISGGYLNPAVALGFAVDGQSADLGLWSAIVYYLKVFIYWIPEFIGAWVAAILVRWITYRRTSDYHVYSKPGLV